MIDALPPADAGAQDRARLREAGAAFEAMMLQQILGSALPEAAAGGGLALQAIARTLAADSPFGIAALLEAKQ
jgi:hypothetical protein